MVEIAIDPDTQNGFIRLTPNQSMHWQVVLLLVSILSLVIFIIALYMTSQGAWVVLPFSGLEIMAIVVANYFVLHRNAQKEVIAFSNDKVTIAKGKKHPSISLTLPRHEAQSKIIAPRHAWYPARVVLYALNNNESITVGNFLNEDDHQLLIKALNAALIKPDKYR